VIVELWACEKCVLQVINEQQVNNSQLTVQRDSTLNLVKDITDKNQCLVAVMAEVWRTVPELDIPEVESIYVRVQKLICWSVRCKN